VLRKARIWAIVLGTISRARVKREKKEKKKNPSNDCLFRRKID
jgi:hypothetical protein